MRTVLQRVERASITVEGNVVASIGRGICALFGFARDDTEDDIDYMVNKILGLRIFNDSEGFMNLSLQDISAELLLVPQFTLYGDARKGRRPSFSNAMEPARAQQMFNALVDTVKNAYHPQNDNHRVNAGIFGAHMQVEIHNDGPVTILLDSSRIL